MSLPRELTQQVRRLDEYELRRLLIFVRGLLLHVDGHPGTEPGLPSTLTYRQEEVRCGKQGCTRCPHGPYWYAYWKEEGRTRKRYIGRHLPGEPMQPVVPDAPTAPTVQGARTAPMAPQQQVQADADGVAPGHDVDRAPRSHPGGQPS